MLDTDLIGMSALHLVSGPWSMARAQQGVWRGDLPSSRELPTGRAIRKQASLEMTGGEACSTGDPVQPFGDFELCWQKVAAWIFQLMNKICVTFARRPEKNTFLELFETSAHQTYGNLFLLVLSKQVLST